MILPVFGMISEIVSVHSRKPIFGYKAIAYSSVAICGLGLDRVGAPYVYERHASLVANVFYDHVNDHCRARQELRYLAGWQRFGGANFASKVRYAVRDGIYFAICDRWHQRGYGRVCAV